MTTSTNTLERIKEEKNLYSAFKETILKLSKSCISSMTEEDEAVLRWQGLYPQRPKEDGYFMLRLKLPNGIVHLDQLKIISAISKNTGREKIDLTTRQDIQLRWITLADMPDIFSKLSEANIYTAGSCGDVVRNVIGCPVTGLAKNELTDTTDISNKITDLFLNNQKYANLPRKFKIAICGCQDHCVPAEINDIGLIALKDTSNKTVYKLFIGGGLSTKPRLADDMNIIIPENELLEVITKTVEIFKDHGNRKNRNKARLKYLIAEWGKEVFLEELEKRLNKKLTVTPDAFTISHSRQDHTGVFEQKNSKYFIGIPVSTGRLQQHQLDCLIEIMGSLNINNLRITHYQNLILPDVPKESLDNVLIKLNSTGFNINKDNWEGKVVVCTGKEYCNKALTQTKSVAKELIEVLNSENIKEDVNIFFSGCPNGCGQNAFAKLGIQGCITKKDSNLIETYNIWAGGEFSSDNMKLAQPAILKLNREELLENIKNILLEYNNCKSDHQSFSSFLNTRF